LNGLQPGAGRQSPLDIKVAGRFFRRTGIGGFHLLPNGSPHAKKNEIKPWLKRQWCIPPQANAAFVCAMEDILALYKRPYDPDFPVICMDETSKQLTKEVRRRIKARPGRTERFDYEYERNGVCNLFMFYEPFGGWRHVSVTDRRTKVDWAHQIRALVFDHFPDARKIILVMDNYTHAGASLYEAFPPEEARQIYEHLEIHPTPKHGSWLNIAEIELRVLIGQCFNRRIPDVNALAHEVDIGKPSVTGRQPRLTGSLQLRTPESN